jgi:hypothetical protein
MKHLGRLVLALAVHGAAANQRVALRLVATCSVTAAGIDDLALDSFTGGVDGTFKGAMDLSKRPLGKITGTFVASGSSQPTPFCGTFRLPFSVSKSKRDHPSRHFQNYYLADDFTTLIPIHKSELSLGLPTVRLELNFHGNCAAF